MVVVVKLCQPCQEREKESRRHQCTVLHFYCHGVHFRPCSVVLRPRVRIKSRNDLSHEFKVHEGTLKNLLSDKFCVHNF